MARWILAWAVVGSMGATAWAAVPPSLQNWCSNEGGEGGPDGNHYLKPECYTSPEHGGLDRPTLQLRLLDVCRTGSPATQVNVDIVMPASLPAGVTMSPIVFQHGGGVASSFCDMHYADGPPYNCGGTCDAQGVCDAADGPGHFTNPYEPIARRLAGKGSIVMFPILESGGTIHPATLANKLVRVIGCLTDRTTAGCGGDMPCIPELHGKIAWTNPRPRPTATLPTPLPQESKLVFMGHSNGGVVGLYLPQMLPYTLKAIIMIDGAKDDAFAQMPPTNFGTRTPIIHLYPDYYGPYHNGQNNLFSLGTNPDVTGPWVPIGIKDDSRAGWECDPDAGCHDAAHCMTLSDEYAWAASPFDYWAHDTYCNAAVQSCAQPTSLCEGSCSGTGVRCQAQYAPCAGGAACIPDPSCGRDTVCRYGPTNCWGTNCAEKDRWSRGAAYQYATRYAVAYAACYSATYGARYQSWVNGLDRLLDEGGWLCTLPGGTVNATALPYATPAACAAAGFQWNFVGALCTQNGRLNSTCQAHTGEYACRAAGCQWSEAEDWSAIRLNKGRTVAEYNASSHRYYRQVEEGYNPTTGAFVERIEKISDAPWDPRWVSCGSGNAPYP